MNIITAAAVSSALLVCGCDAGAEHTAMHREAREAIEQLKESSKAANASLDRAIKALAPPDE